MGNVVQGLQRILKVKGHSHPDNRLFVLIRLPINYAIHDQKESDERGDVNTIEPVSATDVTSKTEMLPISPISKLTSSNYTEEERLNSNNIDDTIDELLNSIEMMKSNQEQRRQKKN
ncbi:hypothetical protein Glove_155g12 [Diversispora epigaea]|uniref:Uncharacterized protein n=1 Tax=Diversispora epigaea TaxID=1348612 RepID=A0A397IWU2_9GLOM|nr:hypothetical protein Glove_155g12 [Diversispora epigaea]